MGSGGGSYKLLYRGIYGGIQNNFTGASKDKFGVTYIIALLVMDHSYFRLFTGVFHIFFGYYKVVHNCGKKVVEIRSKNMVGGCHKLLFWNFIGHSQCFTKASIN